MAGEPSRKARLGMWPLQCQEKEISTGYTEGLRGDVERKVSPLKVS